MNTLVRWSAALLVASGLLVGSSLMAQDFRAEPVYGHLHLESPIGADTRPIAIAAGGHANARTLAFQAGCSGYFNPEAPHITLHYKASGKPLQIYAHSAADTALIIREPGGAWRCDDDSLAKNPAIRFASPKSGEYAIWVAAFNGGRPQANLHIVER